MRDGGMAEKGGKMEWGNFEKMRSVKREQREIGNLDDTVVGKWLLLTPIQLLTVICAKI